MKRTVSEKLMAKPCIKCGEINRRPSDGTCRSCNNRRSLVWALGNPGKVKLSRDNYRKANPNKDREYRLANLERLRALDKAYAEANREKARKRAAEWLANNKERAKAYSRRYRMEHREERLARKHIRRAKKRSSGGVLSKGLARRLFKLQKGKCACCRKPLGDDYHLDHIMPIALGGENMDHNIQLLRKECNLSKQAKHPVDFMQSRGFLL